MSLWSTLRALHRGQVEFVVVGGVAATFQGSSWVTNDLDICYNATPENIERLAAVLRELRAELRGADPGLPFVLDARTLKDCPLLTLTTTEGFLDVMDEIPGVGRYSEALRTSDKTSWDGLEFFSLSLSALIAAKRATGRPKDRQHLKELEAIQKIEMSERRRFLD